MVARPAHKRPGFHPMMRWGEAYTHALHAARTEAGRIKLTQLDYCSGVVARIEPGDQATVDVVLKRKSTLVSPFFDHPVSVVVHVPPELGVGVGDIVLLRNLENKKKKEAQESADNKNYSTDLANPTYMYDNLHQNWKKGTPKPSYVSIFGDQHGFGTDVDMKLAYMQQNFQPRDVYRDPTHYQPHSNPIYGANRRAERMSTLSAQAEIRGLSETDKDALPEGTPLKKRLVNHPDAMDKIKYKKSEYSLNYQRSEPTFLSVSHVMQRAGYSICPIHECRTQGIDYIEEYEDEIDEKIGKKSKITYPKGQLNEQQIKEHKRKLDLLRNREWEPEYYTEMSHKSLEEIELTHEHTTEEPMIAARRTKYPHFKPGSVYEPDLNTILTHPGRQVPQKTIYEEFGPGKFKELFDWSKYAHANDKKLGAESSRNTKEKPRNLSGIKGRNFYSPKYNEKMYATTNYYKHPQVRQMPDAVTNMSNRVTEKRANPHDKKWKIR